MGGNAAIPRTTLERFGLWDECTPIEDEPSLAYRINAGKRDDEYLLFDPDVKMIRRLDVPGRHGASARCRGRATPSACSRSCTTSSATTSRCGSCCSIPAYIYFVAFHCIEWICSDSKKHQTIASRIVGDAPA